MYGFFASRYFLFPPYLEYSDTELERVFYLGEMLDLLMVQNALSQI